MISFTLCNRKAEINHTCWNARIFLGIINVDHSNKINKRAVTGLIEKRKV
jgi:hypothetical protein